MAADRDWAELASDEAFQGLVGALVCRSSPTAQAFLARGRDGSIDALDAVSRTVYQAKYRPRGSPSEVISDARGELKKILAIRGNSKSRFHKIWTPIENWVLCTTIQVNASTESDWKSDVVPVFAAAGLNASLWSGEALRERLRAHEGIREEFFSGVPRSFIGLGEVAQHVDASLELRDRANQLGALKEALRRSLTTDGGLRLATLQGIPKAGMTRLMMQVASDLFREGAVQDVRWARLHAVARADNWYSKQAGKILFVFDSPTEPELLTRIVEEAQDGAIRNATFLVGGYPTHLLTLLRNIPKSRRPERTAEIGQLSFDGAKLVAADLANDLERLDPKKSEKFKSWLVETSSRLVGWMTGAVDQLAAQTLEDQFEDIKDISETFVGNAVSSLRPNETEARTILRWVAATQPVDMQIEDRLDALARLSKIPKRKVCELIALLCERGVLKADGVKKRLVRVHPRTLRHAVLVSWLSYRAGDERRLSDAAEHIARDVAAEVAALRITVETQRTIESIAMVEEYCSGADSVLDVVERALLDAFAKERSAAEKLLAIEVAFPIAELRPSSYVQLLRLLREQSTTPVEMDGHRLLRKTHEHVLLRLPRALGNAARYARTPEEKRLILEEYERLLPAEKTISRSVRKTVMTDERAARIVAEVISRISDTESAFTSVALECALDLLEELKTAESVSPERVEWAGALISPLLAVERMEFSGGPRGEFSFARLTPHHGHEAFLARVQLRAALWEALTKSTIDDVHGLILGLLNKSHTAALQAERAGGDAELQTVLREELADDLARCAKYLKVTRVPELLKSAREIWDWHLDFEPQGPQRDTAIECEDAYRAQCRFAPFAELIWAKHDQLKAAVDSDVRRLREIRAAADRLKFFERTLVVWGQPGLPNGLSDVAWLSGHESPETGSPREFLMKAFGHGEERIRRIAVFLLSGHLHAAREAGSDVRSLIPDLVPQDAHAVIIRQLYSVTGWGLVDKLQAAELELLLAAIQDVGDDGAREATNALSVFISHYPHEVLAAFEALVRKRPLRQRASLIGGLAPIPWTGCLACQAHLDGRAFKLFG